MLENFLVKIAKVPQNFTPNAFVEEVVAEMKAKIGNDKVVLGLFGWCRFNSSSSFIEQSNWRKLILYFRK